MARKSRTDILEKLSALKPSEPTKTRGKAARKPAAKPARVKKAALPKAPGRAAPAGKPKAQPPPAEPKPAAAPRDEFPFPGYAAYLAYGDVSRTVQGVYESWSRIIRCCSGAAADCNEIFLRSLFRFADPVRWWRL